MLLHRAIPQIPPLFSGDRKGRSGGAYTRRLKDTHGRSLCIGPGQSRYAGFRNRARSGATYSIWTQHLCLFLQKPSLVIDIQARSGPGYTFLLFILPLPGAFQLGGQVVEFGRLHEIIKGAQFHTLDSCFSGAVSGEQMLEDALRFPDIHYPNSRLLCLEVTHVRGDPLPEFPPFAALPA